ncbi:unnamed protein product, partial [Microthlaspi erraticum]
MRKWQPVGRDQAKLVLGQKRSDSIELELTRSSCRSSLLCELN